MFGTFSNMPMLGLGPAMNAVFTVAGEKGNHHRGRSSRASRSNVGQPGNSQPGISQPGINWGEEPRPIVARRRIAAWCDHLAVNLLRAAIRLQPAAGGPPSDAWGPIRD